MDKDNFIIEHCLDSLKEVSLKDLFEGRNRYLRESEQVRKDQERMIKQFEEYKKRLKGE